jgi:hypothetical protein
VRAGSRTNDGITQDSCRYRLFNLSGIEPVEKAGPKVAEADAERAHQRSNSPGQRGPGVGRALIKESYRR